MKVLVACEESQRVCIAFREKGHEAYSCDIQECSGGHPEWHIVQDVLPLLNGRCTFLTSDGQAHKVDGKWDLLIAFPPCTYLTNAASVRLMKNGILDVERFKKSQAAKDFFLSFYTCDIDKVCIENPLPQKIHNLPNYSQIIQPYMFGDPWKKRTCLWLKNLPILFATDFVVPVGNYVYASSKQKLYNDGIVGVSSAKLRSKTFEGVARAMAEQWG